MLPVSIALFLYPILLLIVFALTLTYSAKTVSYSEEEYLYGYNSKPVWTFAICLFATLWMGLRPIGLGLYSDSDGYAATFYRIAGETPYGVRAFLDDVNESLFYYIAYLCSKVTDANGWFTVVAAGYVFFIYGASKKIFSNNYYIAILMFLGAFSTWNYGVNGLRNGLACSIMMLAIAYALPTFERPGLKIPLRQLVLPVLLAVLAYNMHHSALLPICAFVLAYIFRDTKIGIAAWIMAILLYFTAHGFFEQLFSSFEFDDRLEEYLEEDAYTAGQSKFGFRWDFLLYSAMPILLGFYTNVIRKAQDQTYNVLLNTYIFSNAVWILLMNASFSNRFAYLSWFLYPFVLAYPCLKIDLWGNLQARNSDIIILLHIGFTIFMTFIFYGVN